MFKKDDIDLIYRLICLVTFCFVILFSNNILTLILLSFFFFLNVKNENNFLYCLLFFLTFFFVAFEYFGNSSYFFSKMVVIVSYCYYFLIIPSFNKKIQNKMDGYLNKKYHLSKESKEEDTQDEKSEDEQSYIRFTKSRKSLLDSKSDLPTTIYVTYHLMVLFFMILLGGLVIK